MFGSQGSFFAGRERVACIYVQIVNESRGRQHRWIQVGESRFLNETIEVRNLIVREHLLPTSLSDNHTVAYLPGVGQKLTEANNRHAEIMRALERRCSRRITEGCLVRSFDEIAGFLELDRKEE